MYLLSKPTKNRRMISKSRKNCQLTLHQTGHNYPCVATLQKRREKDSAPLCFKPFCSVGIKARNHHKEVAVPGQMPSGRR